MKDRLTKKSLSPEEVRQNPTIDKLRIYIEGDIRNGLDKPSLRRLDSTATEDFILQCLRAEPGITEAAILARLQKAQNAFETQNKQGLTVLNYLNINPEDIPSWEISPTD